MHIMISDDGLFYHDLLAPALRQRAIQVTQAKSIRETYAQLAKGVFPDVILLDVDFSRSGEGSFAGLRAARDIRERFPEIGLLVWSQHNELRIAREVISIGRQGGRVGYVLKDKLEDVPQLLNYASTVQAGGISIDAELHGFANRGGKLTPMQRKVVEQISQGFTNKAIATQLRMSVGTVERHISAIRIAYGLPSLDEDPEVNIRVLIVLAYLSDTTGHSEPDPDEPDRD
ncbi:DNA-binding NarL/FixJ family response regulator [Streptomyces umbrinus]|uniref:DNA-binding NarL/FixJ family response regulator n=1 Tax=Streptomyces umbrinus TaxID=67370 RepID=A0ABU0T5Z6_9ACTN|nr:response regulator transcription factor [Streptomyces umbrinus]MDQ1031230.1 DNA-binding NarL/FixJ family response regulator [Streptomyces umbrinus]